MTIDDKFFETSSALGMIRYNWWFFDEACKVCGTGNRHSGDPHEHLITRPNVQNRKAKQHVPRLLEPVTVIPVDISFRSIHVRVPTFLGVKAKPVTEEPSAYTSSYAQHLREREREKEFHLIVSHNHHIDLPPKGEHIPSGPPPHFFASDIV